MKKLKLLSVLFAGMALFSVTSCNNGDNNNNNNDDNTPDVQKELESISISGQKTEFTVGDTFEVGNLKVNAKYTDGSSKDVTASATVTHTADMSKEGTYKITVTYEGKNQEYTITVSKPANVETLKGIELNSDNAKKVFTVGDEFVSTGLSAKLTYSNSQITTDTVKENVTDLSGFTFTIKDSSEAVVTSLAKGGKYTVVVASGEISDSYEIVVNYVNYATVSEALEAGFAKEDKVVSGTVSQTAISDSSYTANFMYEFGKDYVAYSDDNYTHYSYLTEDEEYFGVSVNDYGVVPNDAVIPEYLNGYAFTGIAGSYSTQYGIEGLLSTIYDYKEEAGSEFTEKVTVNEADYYLNTKYEFSTYHLDEDTQYLYHISVEFTLNEDGVIDNIKITSKSYVTSEYDADNDVWNDIITLVDGKYVIPTGTAPKMKYEYTIDQVVGERVKENQYKKDIFYFASYDITEDYAGEKVCKEAYELKVEDTMNLYFKNGAPDSALISIDTPVVRVLDVTGVEVTGLQVSIIFDGMYRVTANEVGEYFVEFKTANVTKTIKYTVAEKQSAPGISTNDPLAITQLGDITATVAAEGYVFYTYTPTEAITVTLSATDANADINYSTFNFNLMDMLFGTKDIELTAGQTLYISVSTLDSAAANIEFSLVEKETGSGSGDVDTTVRDINGLGGEYSITYIMEDDIVLTFTPTAANATTGTLNVVDNLGNPATNITYSYEFVDGAYVFYLNNEVISDLFISNDTQSWTFQNASLRIPQAFAQYEAPSTGDEDENPSGTISVETTDTYAWFTDTYYFTAEVAGTYTFTVPAGLGFWSSTSMQAPELDYYDNSNGDTVTLELAANQEISFDVAATTKDTWTITWVCEPSQGGSGDVTPDEPEVTVVKDANGLGGEYSITWVLPNMFVLTFTPNAEGATTGTLVVVDNNKAANGGTFTYEIVDGAYVIYKDGSLTTDVIISNDLINWTFQNKSALQPQAFAEYEAPSTGDED